MSTQRAKLDSSVPVGSQWFDYVLEETGLSVNEVKKTYDSDPDFEVPDPVTNFWKAAAAHRFDKDAGVADQSWSDWDEPRPLVKRFTNPLNFEKGTVGYKLKITRVEEKIINGDKWSYAYDAGDELVSARVIS
jgi:hypothetical protein